MKSKQQEPKTTALQLEAGSILITPSVKMPNFTAEKNMFTAWYKKNNIFPNSDNCTGSESYINL